jgi:mono/diheme cytochrome c family protein
VTVKQDYCFLCHQNIAKDRPSHKDVAFDTCSSSGCHKYHDNRATYEKFIFRALDQPETKLKAFIKLRGLENPLPKDAVRLTAEQVDAPPAKRENAAITAEWLASRHAEGGVNCSGCHQPASAETKAEGENQKPVEASVKTAWVDKPDHKVCASCHATEVKGFTEGKHGMRLGAPTPETKEALFGLIPEKRLTPMKPEMARLPMVPESHGKELGCTSCHGAHDSKTAKAQVEACLSCHNDDHSRAFKQSPHFALWESEQAGRVKAGEGVSCATCHMPRENVPQATGKPRIVAAHNQNMNLRPNEKMARNVCLDCHGLEFTLNALADRALIQRNFSGRPQHHNAGFDWVRAKNGKPVKAAPAQTTPADGTPAATAP